jgi:predicted dehydrogenase
VIGVGKLGLFHARLMKESPLADLRAVVDPDPARAAEVAAEVGAQALTSIDELPDDVLAVSVAVPTLFHHRVTMPLLERGLHVLVEKPMAADLDEARAMQALASDRDLVLQVGHIERFNPALEAYLQLGVEPRFIEAHRLAPFNFRTLDTSVVMDLMIHDIDIVLELAKSPVVRVDAVGSRVLGRHEDIANARLTFESGCVANITASRVSFEPMRRTRVFGDDTFCSIDFGTRRAFVVRKAVGFDLGSLDLEAAAARNIEPKDTFKEFLNQGLLDHQEIDMQACNPLLMEIEAFLGNVRGAAAGGVPGHQGLRAMEVALEITTKIREHRWAR